jgi:hypothetical protein
MHAQHINEKQRAFLQSFKLSAVFGVRGDQSGVFPSSGMSEPVTIGSVAGLGFSTHAFHANGG